MILFSKIGTQEEAEELAEKWRAGTGRRATVMIHRITKRYLVVTDGHKTPADQHIVDWSDPVSSPGTPAAV